MPTRAVRRVTYILKATHFNVFLDFLHDLFALFVAFALVSFIWFSQVPVQLFIFPAWFSTMCIGIYALIMMTIPFWKTRHFELHAIGAALAVLVFTGRGLGFLEIVLVEDRYDLIAAVFERVFIIIGLVIWHSAQVFKSIQASGDLYKIKTKKKV